MLYIFNKYKTEKRVIDFENDKNNYFSFRTEFKNSVKEDIEKKFNDAYGVSCSELRSIEDKSLDNLLEEKKKNSQQYKELLKNFTKEKVDLYLLFDCLDELKDKDNKETTNAENYKKTLEEIISEAKKLAENPEYVPNVQTEKIDASIKYSGKGSPHRFGTGSKTGKVNDTREENGLAGEIAVYETLKKEFSTVEWLSENATKYGLPHSGNDSLGYDMAYINKNNERIKVEVKATTGGEIEFELSNKELSVALEDPCHYEVFFVFLKHNERPKILNLGNLFKFDNENESPFSNAKFTIQYDNYIIKAKEKRLSKSKMN